MAMQAFTRAGFRLDLAVYRSRVADYVTVYDQARRGVAPGVRNARTSAEACLRAASSRAAIASRRARGKAAWASCTARVTSSSTASSRSS